MPYFSDDYAVGGSFHNNESGRSQQHSYNSVVRPESPFSYSELTAAKEYYDEQQRDPDAPITVSIIAPKSIEEGYTIDVLYNDEPHTVVIPQGGVREGETFKTTIDPKRPFVRHESSIRRIGKKQMLEEDEGPFSTVEFAVGDRFSGNSHNRIHEGPPSKLVSAQVFGDESKSEYTIRTDADDFDKVQNVETRSLSDEEDYETIAEKTHLQKQNKPDDDMETADNYIEKGNQEGIWYDENGTPNGGWRTRVLSCCDVLTQSTFWMGLFCTPVLMAQLITRLKLTWNGREGDLEETSLSYNRIVLGLVFAMSTLLIPLMGALCLFIYYLIVIVYVGSYVRGYMREKYKIPATLPTRCGDRLDNCFMMLFCGCCSTIQMARHTHDDKEYPGHACTTTGLEFDAPEIV